MWMPRTLPVHILFSSLLFLAFLASPLLAQEGQCDQYLVKSAADDAQGYRWRVSRCEGRYAQDVSGSGLLRIVSLTESFEDFMSTSVRSLRITWPLYGREGVRLRAISLRRRLYFRMDRENPREATAYDWPSDVVRNIGLVKKEIGVLGWAAAAFGNTRREIYLPLRIGQSSRPSQATMYEVVVLPGAALKDMYYSLAPVGAEGRPGVFLKKNQSLGGSYYSAGQAVRLVLPELRNPGVYFLEVGAVLQDGRPATVTMWFYHAAR